MADSNKISFQPNSDFDGALNAIDNALPKRELVDFLERTNLSADAKAIIFDISEFVFWVGDRVVRIGRKIISLAISVFRAFPNTTFGVALALVLGSLGGGLFAGVPIVGAAIAGFLKSVLLIFGIASGGLVDLREGEIGLHVRTLMDEIASLANLGN